MHIRISPQRALASEDLDLGPLDFPKTWPMKPTRTWLKVGEKGLPARQAGTRNAYYSVGKGQQWMEENQIDCGSVRYGHYLWDRAVWVTAVIASLLFDCETGTVVVTFHGADDDDFHIVDLSARLLLRLRAHLVHFHQLPFGSQAQLNLQSHLRSTCLDVFAQHVLPALRQQDAISASPTIWLAQRQRRNFAKQASMFAAQIAEKLMLAVDGPLDPELEDWQKSHNDGSLWHCTEFLLSFNSRIDFGRRKALSPEGRSSSASSEGPPSSPRSCSSCEGSDSESDDAGRSSPTPVANEGDDDDGECLRKAFAPFKNDFTLDQRALEWIEPRRMAKLCPPDLGKRGISIQKWDRAAIQSLEDKICAVVNNIRRTEKLIEDEEAIERVRLASMQPDTDELDKSWPPEKKANKNKGKERSGAGHVSTKKRRKSSGKGWRSTKVAHAKKWADALPVADPASDFQLRRTGREGTPGPYATGGEDSPVITGKSAHETLLKISHAQMAIERYVNEQKVEQKNRKRKRQSSEAMTDTGQAQALVTGADALNAEAGGVSPQKKIRTMVRNASKSSTGIKKRSKGRNYFSSGPRKAVDAHSVKAAGGAAGRALETIGEVDEDELDELDSYFSQRRVPVVMRQKSNFVLSSSARVPIRGPKTIKWHTTWSSASSSSESDEDDDDTDWQVKDRPFSPPSRFSAAMSARTSFNSPLSRPTCPIPGKVLRAGRPKQPMPGRELVRQKSVHDVSQSSEATRGSPTTVEDLGDGFDRLDMDLSSDLTDESSSDEDELDDEPARFAAPKTEANDDDDEDVIFEEVSCSSSYIDVPPGLDYCIELGQVDDFELGILSPPAAGENATDDDNTSTQYASLFEERWSEVKEEGDMSFSSTESEGEEDMTADAMPGTSIAVPRLTNKAKVRAIHAIGEEEDSLAPIRQFLQDQGTEENEQQNDTSTAVNATGEQASDDNPALGSTNDTGKEAQCDAEETSFVQGMLELCGLKVHKSSSAATGKGINAAHYNEARAKMARAAARAALATAESSDGWLGLSSSSSFTSSSSPATRAMALVHRDPRDIVRISTSGIKDSQADKSPYAQTSSSSSSSSASLDPTASASTPLTPRRSGTSTSLSQNQRITKTYLGKRAARGGNVAARAGGSLSPAPVENGSTCSPGSPPPRGPEERRTCSQSPYRASSLSATDSSFRAAPAAIAQDSGPMDVNRFLASLAG